MNSSCCKTEVTINTGYDGDICRDCRQNRQNCEGGHTMYYICSRCQMPVDEIPMTPLTIKEKIEELITQGEGSPYEPDYKGLFRQLARLICEEMQVPKLNCKDPHCRVGILCEFHKGTEYIHFFLTGKSLEILKALE